MEHNCCNVFLSKLEVLPEWNSAQQVTPAARVARGWRLLVYVREITTVLDHDTNQTEQGKQDPDGSVLVRALRLRGLYSGFRGRDVTKNQNGSWRSGIRLGLVRIPILRVVKLEAFLNMVFEHLT